VTTTTRRIIRPQAGPQSVFLSTRADIAVYGGAAGGGKSWALLYEPLRHVNNPRFGCVFFRRESPQITNEGGLWDESQSLYPFAGATPRVGDLDWTFRSGAKVSFRHLQHEADKFKWQGPQIPLIQFDELTHFTKSQFWYMVSRNRSTCGVRPYIRASTNPCPGWVKEFLAQWVDTTHPDPARSGELRWFVRVKGELVWARSRAELAARHPGLEPLSVTFVRASIFDNKVLLAKDPGYLGKLQSLPDVERRQLLDGDWDVRREGLVYPGLAGLVCGPGDVPADGERIGGIDFGFNDPFCALRAVVNDDVLWVDWERYRSWETVPQHAEHLPPGPCWYADPGRPDSIMELNNGGHRVRACVHKAKKNKRPLIEGIAMVADRIRTGRLRVSRDCQNLLREAGLYAYGEGGEPEDKDNHAMDALRYLVVGHDRGRTVNARPAPEPTEAEIAAAAEADRLRREAERAEFLDPDNAHWWGESGDDG
jgi:Terminase large subunit, T4likevirus-type, N-terminal